MEPALEPSFVLEDHMNINDATLFNYFLNEDLASYSTYDDPSLSPSSDSPQTSPPQLIPDSPHPNGTQLSGFLDNSLVDKSSFIQIKEEVPPDSLNPDGTTQIHSSERKRALKDSSAALSREELVKLSSNKGLDALPPNNGSSNKSLSHDEERQIKRQRRLIKNRESAQLSRMRKKIYIEELERKVNHLTAENDALTKQLFGISTDKRKLEEEVAYLQNIIKQSPQLIQLQTSRQSPPTMKLNSTKNVKTAGICLLIVLFSFGLLFNTANNDFPLSKDLQKSRYSGRAIKSIKDDSLKEKEDGVRMESAVENIHAREKRRVESSKKESELSVSEGKKPTDVTQVAPASLKRKKMTIADEGVSAKELVPHSHVNQELKNDSLQVLPPGAAHPLVRPDTSYIYCSEARQVQSVGSNKDPQNIALLIPSSVLNATLDSRLDKSLLEVTCQVLNLHLWPLTSQQNNNTMKP